MWTFCGMTVSAGDELQGFDWERNPLDGWCTFMVIRSELDANQACGCVRFGVSYRIVREGQVVYS